MPSYRASFARGALFGAGAVALWATARLYSKDRPTQGLIDWDRAAEVADPGERSRRHPPAEEKARLQLQYEEMIRGIESPDRRLHRHGAAARQHPGSGHGSGRLDPGQRHQLPGAVCTGRRAVRRDRLGQSTGLPVLGDAGRLLLSAQAGLLIGYLARKVLGQYDISLLGKEPLTEGKLYFVEPNIRAVERTLQVPGDELRRWIALHEATHAHEFEVNPWVRSYLNEHLQAYLRSVLADMREGSDPAQMTRFFSRLIDNLRGGHNLIEALMTPDQRGVLSELQALMSLAEGYSNHVMNQVGVQLLPHFEEIHQRVEHRQKQSRPGRGAFPEADRTADEDGAVRAR